MNDCLQDNPKGMTSDLGTAKTGRLMRRYAIPCVISLLVAALYNIVDQIFIANADYLGSFGNAANAAVFPLTVLALAVAVMIGDGCCAYVSLCLGSRDTDRAHRSVGNAVILSVLAGIVLTVLYLLLADPLITLFGGAVNERTMECSREYFFWITLGILPYVFGQAMNPVIRSDGSPKYAMFSTLAGAAANLILDPIFIYPLQMGMMGAAVATVIGQIVTAALAVIYLCRMKCVQLTKNSFRPDGYVIRKSLSLGICSFLAQISLVIAMATTNQMIAVWSARDSVFGLAEYTQIPMAVFGIVMKVFQIVISISIGVAAGCIPIVGFNIGAGYYSRAKEIFRKLLLTEFMVGAVALVIVLCFPRGIIAIFGAGGESTYYTEFAVRTFRIYLCMLPLATVNKATFIFLQSLGRPVLSTFLSMLREVVLGSGFVLVLPHFFGLNGVLYSMPAADVLTAVASLIIILYVSRTLKSDATESGTK